MKNDKNGLIKVKSNIFSKIIDKIKSLFSKKESVETENIVISENTRVNNLKEDLNSQISKKQNKFIDTEVNFEEMDIEELDDLLIHYENEVELKEEKLNALKDDILKLKNKLAC